LVSLRNRGIDSSAAEKALKKTLDTETELALLTRYMERSPPGAGNSCKAPFSGFSPRAMLKFEGFSQAVLSIYFED
jgi:hypothetical protein